MRNIPWDSTICYKTFWAATVEHWGLHSGLRLSLSCRFEVKPALLRHGMTCEGFGFLMRQPQNEAPLPTKEPVDQAGELGRVFFRFQATSEIVLDGVNTHRHSQNVRFQQWTWRIEGLLVQN